MATINRFNNKVKDIKQKVIIKQIEKPIVTTIKKTIQKANIIVIPSKKIKIME